MRTRLGFGALLVSSAILIGWFVSQAAVPIPVAAKDEKKATADDRDEKDGKRRDYSPKTHFAHMVLRQDIPRTMRLMPSQRQGDWANSWDYSIEGRMAGF